jgi:hypothetical protein
MGRVVNAVPFIGGLLLATALLLADGLVASATLIRKAPDRNRVLGGGIAAMGVALLFADPSRIIIDQMSQHRVIHQRVLSGWSP